MYGSSVTRYRAALSVIQHDLTGCVHPFGQHQVIGSSFGHSVV